MPKMDPRIEKLKTMQTASLIDVAKNYKKYNYPETIKDEALLILANRGVKQESLKISGKLNNTKYEEAIQEYKKYNVNSILGLILFCISMFIYSTNDWAGLGIYLVALLFIGLSFANSKKIAKLLDDDNIDYSVVILLLSLFLYFVVFFVTRHQIKERIQMRS